MRPACPFRSKHINENNKKVFTPPYHSLYHKTPVLLLSTYYHRLLATHIHLPPPTHHHYPLPSSKTTETSNMTTYMPTLPDYTGQSPRYGTDLPLSRTGHQISRIILFCAFKGVASSFSRSIDNRALDSGIKHSSQKILIPYVLRNSVLRF